MLNYFEFLISKFVLLYKTDSSSTEPAPAPEPAPELKFIEAVAISAYFDYKRGNKNAGRFLQSLSNLYIVIKSKLKDTILNSVVSLYNNSLHAEKQNSINPKPSEENFNGTNMFESDPSIHLDSKIL